MRKNLFVVVFLGFGFTGVLADSANFSTGPIIEGFGPAYPVADAGVTPQSHFQVVFDIADAAKPGTSNRWMESAARFLNMHGAAGVPAENLQVALVVHGAAAMDLTREKRKGETNASAELIAALIEAGVSIELCGQTAAYRNIQPTDLLPGVKMALSAMTAHARLQQKGYTLNPF
ncbi:MAG: DsrE family protein [Lysobacterales bacterium]